MTKRTVRLASLSCDTPSPSVQADYGTYEDIYRDWLSKAQAASPDEQIKNAELVLDAYNVVDKKEYPPAGRLDPGHPEAYDAIMMTGSKHTSFDPQSSFAPGSIEFIRDVATHHQHIPILAVCFGHQIAALALGGECVRGSNGWEIGVYSNNFTKEGRYWWSDYVVEDGADKIYVEQMHKDHVPSVPPGCQSSLTSERYPVHSFVKSHPASTPEQPLAQVLTIQGHPEFTPGIVQRMVNARAEQGIFDGPTTAEANRRLGGKDGHGAEGYGRLGWAMWKVMSQDLPKSAASQNANAANSNTNPQPVNNANSNSANGAATTSAYIADPTRYAAIDKLLDNEGPFTAEFQGADAAKDFLRNQCKVLVIGAGGLGCEILQNLALTGFGDIHVIDMDTIDISNSNRQFLFRESDVGKSKALVAADFVTRRVPGIKVTAHHNKIQDKPSSFYKGFNIIIAGSDSISARRWINATLVNMVDEEDPESLKPLIDGGTEGFKGQARVILPTITSCYECSIDMSTPPTAFPICTIANTPRSPEHCIEWASVLEWPRVFKDKKLDTDDPDHIEWSFQKASARAAEFAIEGVTWQLTQGVVKNIIPAIASTNAIIAASCCNEAFKIATSAAPYSNNYMMYVGNDSSYTFTFEHEKRPDCPVCGGESVTAEVGKDWTLEKLVAWIEDRQEFQIKRPSLAYSDGRPLFFQAPPPSFEQTKGNLEKLVSDLVPEGEDIVVTDPGSPFNLSVTVKYV